MLLLFVLDALLYLVCVQCVLMGFITVPMNGIPANRLGTTCSALTEHLLAIVLTKKLSAR